MCGIFFSLSRHEYISPDSKTEQLLRNRGPDSVGKQQTLVFTGTHQREGSPPCLHGTFLSTVLSLRGTNVVNQPLKDEETGSIFCWNGEAWSIGSHAISGNDSHVVFDRLLKTCSQAPNGSRAYAIACIVDTMASIRGPYAFVFYDARHQLILYGRDCLGRRSLLRKSTPDDEVIVSSVCDNTTGEDWVEVEADGIYMMDLRDVPKQGPLPVSHTPHARRGDEAVAGTSFALPFPAMNQSIDAGVAFARAEIIRQLGASLQRSLELRVQHVREALDGLSTSSSDHGARIAILFSGGLDCTILARMTHDLISPNESIDLLNVAFENPRVHGKLSPGDSPYEQCPDRITGRSSFAELSRVCPGRNWRFIEIDVPYGETVAHRTNVMTLMRPHNTEMDLSISYALYFASRGIGALRDSVNASPQPYTSTAHVLLSGLGADELFGGYQRHAVAFSRRGYPGLIQELELDFNRLGKRNLGRDDRVISDSGKEVRFPYLDEEFIALALELPVSAKCNFANPQSTDSHDPTQFLEPGKRALRLLAWELGIKGVAGEKKRAIQFGARTAKMETGKSKGTQILT